MNPSPLQAKVSMFPNAYDSDFRDCALYEILNVISNGRYAKQIQNLRAILAVNRDEYDRKKKDLPAFYMSGTATDRKTMVSHSNLLQVDMDHLNGTLDVIREKVKLDPHVAFGFVSPSGDGLKLGLVIDGSRHEESFEAAKVYFSETYNTQIDKKVKEWNRLCFVSDDPNLWKNESAIPLPIPVKPPAAPEAPPEPETPARPSKSDKFILPSGEVSITDSARDIFQTIAPKYSMFWRGGALVEVVRQDDVDVLEIIRPDAFRSRVEIHGDVHAWRMGRGNIMALQPTKMSGEDARAIMACSEARVLPNIGSVLRCPVLTEDKDGKPALLKKGFHTELGGILIACDRDIIPVPLALAVQSLSDLVSEFDFQTPGDRSRAIAACITPAMRMGGMLKERIPIDVAEADQSQAGKGYRHNLVCAIYNEPPYFVTARAGGVGSVDESFSAALIAGRPFICLDNFRGKLESQHLEAFVTCNGLFPARVPHRGEVMVNPKRFILQLSSNGFNSTADLANRSSICRIRKRQDYNYRDTLGQVFDYQPMLLGSVFSVLTEWMSQGKPKTNETRHDFREWCQSLDWIIQNLFKSTPLMDGHREAQVRASNPALTWLREMALALQQDDQLGHPHMASELVELCQMHDLAIPGNPEDETKARQRVGILMKQAFRNGETAEIDGFSITRTTDHKAREAGGAIDVKTYTFDTINVQ